MLTYFHPDQLKHRPLTYLSRGKMRAPHEVPERAARLLDAANSLGFDVRAPADFGSAPLAAVHSAPYLRFLADAHREWRRIPEDWGPEVMSNIYVREPNPLRGVLAQAARYLADGSCPIGEHTYRAAYWSAQDALAGAAALCGGVRDAYALCRPPGHHARRDAAGGFCYLNNAAIAAQALRARYARVAILDTDMHHGQGIQALFYDRDDVLYVSIHGDPTNFYPAVTGYEEERGAGRGEGYNVNLPMPHGSAESVFFAQLERAKAIVERFAPDALVFALGFDVYRDDPQSKVAVTTEGFGRLGALVGALRLPTLIVQEGGYHLDTLARNAAAFFGSYQAAR
ncbi:MULTISPECIES: histone deacetylase family protein [Burkholderia]|uniref:Acetylpolyamine aminohydrolase n=1 Tax=Burkholderia savannae TaxID=1637837 RepID=A0ABR5T4G2_9BURK|nr:MULTISPECIES: histone deacetylase family protein [Burkholderia]AOJ71439.1 acetylpolyamine aminohydrolase [Burkholderia savannae]AOK49838.1 acetylpolyamine aminohydrolase [Burkholderia sp. MSMB617WGS]KGS02376.1 histone deacetylase domain protein [Burkholderia sp. ABCPW 111]KVG37170.1 acetylpolyamine aminohydrolase [Burkholderia sp. MSMB0265]KVG77795.1 acetylpolyamine aminohydrolase [Burkholderia sp. MSMB2040]